MSEAIINGGTFKALIDAVQRFPGVGSFVGSDLINLQLVGKELVASTYGIVISRSVVEGAGVLPLIAVDERALSPFSALCTGKSDVTIKVTDKTVQFRTRSREITSVNTTGTNHVIPSITGVNPLHISEQVATKISYLAQIAMNDASRPDLCCVMLCDGEIMACDQKAVAVLKCALPSVARTALPLPIAKEIRKGDQLYTGTKHTVLHSGIGQYAMPSPIRAQKEFPTDRLKKLAEVVKTPVALVSGDKFKEALEECSACLGNIARNEVVVQLSFQGSKLELSAKNGGIKFRRIVPVKEKTNAELNVPLEEAMNASALLAGKVITVSQGANGEAFLKVPDGWVMFPRYSAK
jgi:hypothetical protein